MDLLTATLLTDIALEHDWRYGVGPDPFDEEAPWLDVCRVCGLQRHTHCHSADWSRPSHVWFSRNGDHLCLYQIAKLKCKRPRGHK